jgi:hypothetical protein
MPTQKPAIGVFYKSAGKVVDPPVCIPVKKYQYLDRFVAVLSPRQGKFAGIGKVETYPASQSKI